MTQQQKQTTLNVRAQKTQVLPSLSEDNQCELEGTGFLSTQSMIILYFQQFYFFQYVLYQSVLPLKIFLFFTGSPRSTLSCRLIFICLVFWEILSKVSSLHLSDCSFVKNSLFSNLVTPLAAKGAGIFFLKTSKQGCPKNSTISEGKIKSLK